MGRENIDTDLFPTTSIPHFHEGESLYSWCSRFHHISCNASASKTSLQLFGHMSSGIRPDFPTSITFFYNKSRGLLGTADELLSNRTLFGFYRPFLPAERAELLAKAIKEGGYTNVHNQLGLAASLPEFSGQLRACLDCLQDDLISSAHLWWRIEHQWPSALICHIHQQPLTSPPSIKKHARKDWILPSHIKRDEWQELPLMSSQTLIRFNELLCWSKALSSLSNLQLESSELRYCYLLKLKEQGHLAMDGSLRINKVRNSFQDWIGDCIEWPSLSFIKNIQDVNVGFIGQLVRQYPGIRHPLKHILMLNYLFESLDAFIQTYNQVSILYKAEGDNRLRKELSNTREKLINLVKEQHRSVNSATQELDVSVTQAIKLLKKNNVRYKSRARIVGTDKEKALVLALQQGKDHHTICQELCLRKRYISDYLAQHPNLKFKK